VAATELPACDSAATESTAKAATATKSATTEVTAATAETTAVASAKSATAAAMATTTTATASAPSGECVTLNPGDAQGDDRKNNRYFTQHGNPPSRTRLHPWICSGPTRQPARRPDYQWM
jgi:hypothetical protein